MVSKYAVNVTVRWWVMPILRLIQRHGFILKGVFGEGMTSAGAGITGNPSIEVTYYPQEPSDAKDNA